VTDPGQFWQDEILSLLAEHSAATGQEPTAALRQLIQAWRTIHSDDLVERLAPAAHQGWMRGQQDQGVTTRRSWLGEELMVPYAQLTERAKREVRATVRAAIEDLRRQISS
jgi:hypothetical protein